VLEGGPAQRAGLNPGDVLIAVDRLKVNERNLKKRLARFEDGERITATAFRGDELMEVGLVLRPAPLDTCFLTIEDAPDPEALRLREAWLGG
jgi:predicted metalloprotease with PDZ domain